MKAFCINEDCPEFVPEDKRGYKKKPAAEATEDKMDEKKSGKKTEKKSSAKKPAAKKTAAKKTKEK